MLCYGWKGVLARRRIEIYLDLLLKSLYNPSNIFEPTGLGTHLMESDSPFGNIWSRRSVKRSHG